MPIFQFLRYFGGAMVVAKNGSRSRVIRWTRVAGRIENLLYYMNIEYNTIGYYVVYVIFDPSKNEFSIYAHLHVSFFAFSYTTRTEDIFVHELAIPKRLWGIFGGLFLIFYVAKNGCCIF